MDSLPLAPDQTFPTTRRDALREVLVQMANEQPTSQRHTRRRRVIITSGVAVVVLAGGGTAAAYQWFGSKAVTNHSSARCYVKASTSSDFITVAEPQGSDGSGGQVLAPIDACTEAWRMGTILGIPPPDANPPYPVPQLAGCVMSDGTAAVFPGPAGTCQQLGMATALPG